MKDNRDWVKGAELNKNSLIEYKLSHQKKLCVMINEEQNSFVKQLYYKCTYYTVQIISHSVKFLQCFMEIFFFTSLCPWGASGAFSIQKEPYELLS